MKALLSRKGRVTIPKALRESSGLRPGQILEFREVRGRLVVTKQLVEDPIERVYGILKAGQGTDALIHRLRGPAGAT